MLNQTKRIVIIGGGPAGYEAALAGAKYGAEITIIEDQGMGGNSVILDCVPSKSFIAGANIKTDLRRAEDMELNQGIGQAHLSLTALNKRVQDLASKQSSDIRATVESLGARVIDGRGYFPEDQEADAFGVDARDISAGDAVNLNVARLGGFHANVLQLQVLGIRDGADRHDDMGTGNFAAVLSGHQHIAVLGAIDGFHAAVLFQLNAALAKHGLEDVGSVGVVMRQNAVAGGNHGDLNAQLRKGGDELGTGDAGTDDDEVLRQLGEVINLLPGKDAFAIRLRTR